jgi:hypothetical protein
MSSQIVILAGKKRSGKTESCNLLNDAVNNNLLDFEDVIILNYADSLKDICKSVFNLTYSQLHNETQKETIDKRWGVTPRRLMQGVGDMFRKYLKQEIPELNMKYETIFIENTVMRIKNIMEAFDKDLIIVGDARLQEEIDISKDFNAVSIRLHRENNDKDSHISEQLNVKTEYTIDNNNISLSTLQEKLLEILNSKTLNKDNK